MMDVQNPKSEIQNGDGWQPRILAFLCNWCSYAGADLAGVSRLQYPPNVRVIRVPCSARVDPMFILSALQRGADGVLVSGCHPGDCHYLTGNLVARRRFALLKALLDEVGFEAERVHFSWVSAAEGGRFADLVREVTEKVQALGPAEQFVKRFEETLQAAPNCDSEEKHRQDLSGRSRTATDDACATQ